MLYVVVKTNTRSQLSFIFYNICNSV